MALPINVDDLLRQRKVERTRIEYKSGWNPEPIIHTLTAFANDFDNMGGGYVLIGVEEENGRPVLPVKGINPDIIDDIQLDILNKCNFIEPRFIPVIEPYSIDGREILVLWAPGGEERPYIPRSAFTVSVRPCNMVSVCCGLSGYTIGLGLLFSFCSCFGARLRPGGRFCAVRVKRICPGPGFCPAGHT